MTRRKYGRKGYATGIMNGNSHLSQRLREIEQDTNRDALQSQKQEMLEQLYAEDKAVYRELLQVDPDGGEAWYDDDANIPNYGSTRERIRLVRARVEFLKSQKVGDD